MTNVGKFAIIGYLMEEKAGIMKITIGKNESHDYPRTSYLLEGGDWVKDIKQVPKAISSVWSIAWSVVAVSWVILHASELKGQILLFVLFALLLLPLHELSHALFLWLTGRQVYAIRLSPFPGKWHMPAAYVKADLAILSRGEQVLFSAFPMILLSVLPAVIALFCPPLRIWLLWIAFANAADSSFDVRDILGYFFLPQNACCIGGVWCVLHEEKPVILRRLRIKPGATRVSDVERTDFRVEGKCLVEIPAVGDGRDASGYGIPELLNEFKQQFHLSDT